MQIGFVCMWRQDGCKTVCCMYRQQHLIDIFILFHSTEEEQVEEEEDARAAEANRFEAFGTNC